LSWHLWCILVSLDYAGMEERAQAYLHVQYAEQLERMGLWWWSAFALCHLADENERECTLKHLLAKYAPSAEDDRLMFMRKHLSIPQQWIFEAKALKAHSDGNHMEEAWCNIQCENFNNAHWIFLDHVGPVKVVDEDLEGLKLFLNALSDHRDRIEDWETGGRIYEDYLKLKSEYEEIKRSNSIVETEISTLRELAYSLAVRIKFLRCLNPVHRLCQSEIAFLIAKLLRLTLNDEAYINMGSIISDLPMPDDFIMEELQRLVDVAINNVDCAMLQQ